MFPKGAVTATAPLSWHLAHPKQHGHRDWLLDLPPMAGMGHFLLLLRWETSAWSWGPKLQPRGEEWSVSVCPNYPPTLEHPGCIPPTALLSPPQLHAVPMDHSIPKVKPCLRNPQICNTPSPYGSTMPDQLWDLLTVAWGNPHELSQPQTTETHSSFSFSSSSEDPSPALETPGPCSNWQMPGHTVAMTHTSAGRCFSIPYSFLYSLASSLDQVSCTPKPRGLRVTEVSGTAAQFLGSF